MVEFMERIQMSHHEKQIQEKVSQLEGEKRILEGIKAYYDRSLSFSDLEEISGISITEFKRYQQDNDYPYSLGTFNRSSVIEKADQRIKEIVWIRDIRQNPTIVQNPQVHHRPAADQDPLLEL